jgi:hypothetical protein
VANWRTAFPVCSTWSSATRSRSQGSRSGDGYYLEPNRVSQQLRRDCAAMVGANDAQRDVTTQSEE